MTLRPYQEAAVLSVRRHWGKHQRLPLPERRGALLVMATGTGKTRTGMDLFAAAVARGHRSLWLAHTDELISQPFKTFQAISDAPSVGVVKAHRDDVGATAVFGSIQTLRNGDRLAGYLAHGVPRLVVVDEAHHSVSPSYQAVLSSIDEAADLAGVPRPYRLGLTATPERADRVGLRGMWEMTYFYGIHDALADGYLVPWEIRADALPELDLTGMAPDDSGEDWDPSEMGRRLLQAHVVEATVSAVQRHMGGRTTLVFCATVEQAVATSKALGEAGVSAETVSQKTGEGARKQILRDLEAGRLQVVCNVRVLTEGTDIPRVSGLVLASAFRSKGLYQQAVGRGLRPDHPSGKEDCLIVDLTGASLEHDLVTAPLLVEDAEAKEVEPGLTVFPRVGITLTYGMVVVEVRGEAMRAGVKPGDVLEAVGGVVVGSASSFKAELRQIAEEKTVSAQFLRSGSLISIFIDLPEKAFTSHPLAGLHKERERITFDWVQVPGLDRAAWVLDCAGAGSILLLEEGEEGWRVLHRPPSILENGSVRGRRPPPSPLLRSPVSWGLAVGVGEDVARRSGAGRLLDPGAGWKGKPASDKQIEFLGRLLKVPKGGDVPFSGSAGDAGKAITREMSMREIARLGLALRVDRFLDAPREGRGGER